MVTSWINQLIGVQSHQSDRAVTEVHVPSRPAIGAGNRTVLGVLRHDVRVVVWDRAAQTDDGVKVRVSWYDTGAVAMAFGVGPPLERRANRVFGLSVLHQH